jgi:D-beta-D-heptose 7-phosphate kinase/D-beta-D-heptose 1-phosphate adenosyltransferase
LQATAADQLAAIVQDERNRRRKVVFTNGVFDLIHPGHIRYLRAARAQGDLLVVGLNSDESVRRLKGPARPILPEHERVKIIASLDMVDYVTLFCEETPLEIIRALKPDVLIKGGDYALEEIVGRNEVESAGGRVLTIPFVKGKSSSGIVERIVRSANN